MSLAIFLPDGLLDPLVEFITLVDRRVIQLKQALIVVDGAHTLNTGVQRSDEAERLLEGACNDLVAQVRQCASKAGLKNAQIGSDTVEDFSYLLAAWADEALVRGVNLPPFTTRRISVEDQLFATMVAGEKIFAKIDMALARRSLGDLYLAPTYLLALSLGFRGKFHGENMELVMRYHRALNYMALTASGEAESHSAIESLPDEEGLLDRINRYLPLSILWLAVTLMWLVSVLVADLAWQSAMAPVRATLESIERDADVVQPFNKGPRP